MVENVAVVLGGLSLLAAGASLSPADGDAGDHLEGGDGGGGGGLLKSPLYWIGVVLMGVDAVCSSILEVVVVKDWVSV